MEILGIGEARHLTIDINQHVPHRFAWNPDEDRHAKISGLTLTEAIKLAA